MDAKAWKLDSTQKFYLEESESQNMLLQYKLPTISLDSIFGNLCRYVKKNNAAPSWNSILFLPFAQKSEQKLCKNRILRYLSGITDLLV